MSALRQSVRRPVFWIKLIAAAALAAAAIFDWTRPAAEQVSVRIYERAVIGTYHTYVRPYTSHFIRCRYRPSCSSYSFYAVAQHGFAKGVWLTALRILRCGPWVPMGTDDPVPPPRTINSGSAHHGETHSTP